jgi:hypothetical protein
VRSDVGQGCEMTKMRRFENEWVQEWVRVSEEEIRSYHDSRGIVHVFLDESFFVLVDVTEEKSSGGVCLDKGHNC